MTNEEIIARKAISEGLFTEEEVIHRIMQDEDIPFHTAKGWRDQGYKVKSGENGIECRLWRQKSSKTGKEKAFYQIKSYLFRSDQVEKIENS